MSLILNIDTSTENASICLAQQGQSLAMAYNNVQKEHASWLHPAILETIKYSGKKLSEIAGIGVTGGPGSYTGLRVAMATAKGLCYALNVPLISVNTLDAMAGMAIEEDTDLICPMIDARRMEVFTALYDKNLIPLLHPCAMILTEKSFFDQLIQKKILFFGNGKNKFENIIDQKNAIFKNLIFNASHLAVVTYRKFVKSDFSPIQYAEPQYLKDYNTHFVTKS